MLSLILIFQNAIYSSANNSSTTPKREIKNRYSCKNSKSNCKDVKIESSDNLDASSASANPDLSCKTPQFSIPEGLNINSENVQKAPLRSREKKNPTSVSSRRTSIVERFFGKFSRKNSKHDDLECLIEFDDNDTTR